jgi:hypothetical protein
MRVFTKKDAEVSELPFPRNGQTPMKKKILYSLSIALSVVFVTLWWIRPGNSQVDQPVSETVHVVSDYLTVTSMDDMIQKSSTIVIGKLAKIAGHRNLARLPSDSSKPDSRLTVVGTVYEVLPEKYLKGTSEKLLFVVQSEGLLPYASRLGPADLTTAQSAEAFTPLTVGGALYLFLSTTCPFFRSTNWRGGTLPLSPGK